VGARGRRPLWSPPWVPVTFGQCVLIFYSLFGPCPAPCPALQERRTDGPCPAPCLAALPCPALPLPCKTDRTAGAWVGHVIRCVILKTRSVGLLPLGDESLVSKRSWEASCMSAALKKRDLLFGERFSPFILIHRQNRFCHRKCRPGRFCRWIKMQNCRVRQTHARTHRLPEFIYKICHQHLSNPTTELGRCSVGTQPAESWARGGGGVWGGRPTTRLAPAGLGVGKPSLGPNPGFPRVD
jgi:hypothetical protein